jgi:hypothetical protein
MYPWTSNIFVIAYVGFICLSFVTMTVLYIFIIHRLVQRFRVHGPPPVSGQSKSSTKVNLKVPPITEEVKWMVSEKRISQIWIV